MRLHYLFFTLSTDPGNTNRWFRRNHVCSDHESNHSFESTNMHSPNTVWKKNTAEETLLNLSAWVDSLTLCKTWLELFQQLEQYFRSSNGLSAQFPTRPPAPPFCSNVTGYYLDGCMVVVIALFLINIVPYVTDNTNSNKLHIF